MFSKKINFKSLFPRMILWSTLGLAISLLIVSSIIYFILSTSLKNKDRDNLSQMANTIAAAAAKDQTLITSNFVRPELLFALYDSNGKLSWLALPEHIDKDSEDVEEIAQVNNYAQTQPTQNGWHTIFLNAAPDEDTIIFLDELEDKARYSLHKHGFTNLSSIVDYDMFEVLTVRLSNGGWLRIGTSFEPTDEYLSGIRKKILLVILPFIFIGFLINLVVAVSVLSPVKNLVKTIIRIKDGEKDLRATYNSNGDEIDLLGHEFNMLLDKNDNLITNLKETVDNIAHDLRTPLTHLNSNLELAYLNLNDEELIKSSIEDGFEDISRILKLLNAILDSSESRTQTMQLQLEKIELSNFFEEISELYQYSLEDKKITLKIDCPEALFIKADKTRLFQVFGNLLDNAIKFSENQTEILIKASLAQTTAVIEVIDQGHGISPHDLPRVFERLYRGDKSRTTDGVGLGLSIVQAIIKAHGGQISVKSELKSGSTFSLTLPSCND